MAFVKKPQTVRVVGTLHTKSEQAWKRPSDEERNATYRYTVGGRRHAAAQNGSAHVLRMLLDIQDADQKDDDDRAAFALSPSRFSHQDTLKRDPNEPRLAFLKTVIKSAFA